MCSSVVPTRPKNLGFFYDFPTSGILTTSGNTASQTSPTVGDFYDVIGRTGSISTLKVHPRRSPTSAILTINVNMPVLRICNNCKNTRIEKS